MQSFILLLFCLSTVQPCTRLTNHQATNILVAITHTVDVCVVHHTPVFLQVTFRHPRFELRQLNFVLARMSSREDSSFLEEAAESGPDAR